MGDFIYSQAPSLLAEAEGGSHAGYWGTALYLVFTLAIIFTAMNIAKKGLNGTVFQGWLAGAFEQLYLFIENMCVGTVGPHGRRYMPMIMTFWLVIFTGSLVSLFFPHAPTADFGFNLGMALISIGYVQWEGIKANGLFGHVKHFSGPKLTGFLVIVSGMIFIIELISEFMKNVSLSLRLFANIHGGHEAVENMNHLLQIAPHVYIPLGALLLPLKVLTCIIQAMIFTLLTCVYLSLVTHHEDEHEHAAHPEQAYAMVGG